MMKSTAQISTNPALKNGTPYIENMNKNGVNSTEVALSYGRGPERALGCVVDSVHK